MRTARPRLKGVVKGKSKRVSLRLEKQTTNPTTPIEALCRGRIVCMWKIARFRGGI